MFYRTFIVSLLFVLSVGCTSGRQSEGTVSGTVTFKDKPLAVGAIVFMSPDKKHAASSPFDSDGAYRLHKPLPAGEYLIGFPPPESPDPQDNPGPPTPFPLPGKYFSPEGSGLTFTVEAGPNTANFDLQ